MGKSQGKMTVDAEAGKTSEEPCDKEQSCRKDFYAFERQYSPNDSDEFERQYSPDESYTFQRQLTPNDEGFCFDDYGSDKKEATLIAGVSDMMVSRNPATINARFHTNRTRQLTDDYTIARMVLGSGMTGTVVVVNNKHDGRNYALKRFQKRQLSEDEMRHLSREVQICLSVDHPGIARVHDVYDTQNETCLVMECCEGGELFDRLEAKGQFAEGDVADAALQMLRAVNYLHEHRIVHRDIKLENFLYESKADDAALKLIDFGFAKEWDPETWMMARCGSIAYVSPDVLTGHGYTSQCDVWSLGVVVFMLLSGYPPFHGTDAQIRAKIKGSKPSIHASRWKRVSEEAREFVHILLDKDPCSRPTVQDALQHPWLIKTTSRANPKVNLSSTVLQSLRTYMCSSKLRRTMFELLAQELLADETAELREMFLQMDRHNKGSVSLAELKKFVGEISGDPSIPSSDLSDDTTSSFKKQVVPHTTRQCIAEVIDVFGANGDEQLYYTEFLAATSQTSLPPRVEAVRKVFHRLDRDCSGTISAYDLCEAFGERSADGTAANLYEAEVALDRHGEITCDALSHMLDHHDAVPVVKPLSASCVGTFLLNEVQAKAQQEAVLGG